MTAMQYKLEGNRMFAQKKYEEAIKCYTKAINKTSNNAVFFTNRALCNIKLQKWEAVVDDCKTALDYDPQSVKGHFFLGHATAELENFDESISELQKAHTLAKQQKLNFGDDIAAMLRNAKKKRWDKLEKERISQEIELQTYLTNLMVEDEKREITKLDENDSTSDTDRKNVEKKFEERRTELNNLFAQVDDRRKTREVPDFLCGKISFEIMKDPVITPSGITYDRKDLEEHLQRVGHFDPVTRQKLTASELIPNLAIHEVIEKFIGENGWAEDY
ncbi:E3 ubiquitin-protein ligase CHIP-like [Styela clava]